MCGEHLRKQHSLTQPAGSPPHVRGTLEPDMSEGAEPRITPARAGNTQERRGA